EGREQLFLPYGDGTAPDGSVPVVDRAADPVLLAADGHFHAALPVPAPAPAATALPRPAREESGANGAPNPSGATSGLGGEPSAPPVHRSHSTAPWLPPADADGPRYRLARDGVLTAPDGATYTQGT
ncbi:hypothetical protein GTW46_05290, partial [Streptomyces sp. SID6013]|nr:hypothetical protein [Streptomyces sp. SID6013]